MYRDLLAEQRNTIIGIDLGTTQSLVAIATDCSARVIASPDGADCLPSAIAAGLAGAAPVIGYAALSLREAGGAPVLTSVKRFMGMALADAASDLASLPFALDASRDNTVAFQIGEQSLSAPEISAHYLRELKSWAEADLGRSVRDAVITVPAYFNDAQRQATRDAAEIAGLNPLRIVNEPTAAALAYGLQQRQRGRVAVYDFGGGTFDVSILDISDGVFEVLSTGGDTRLGGDDIDHALARHINRKLHGDSSEWASLPASYRQGLVAIAERFKIQLSNHAEYSSLLQNLAGDEHELRLTRGDLESLARPVVQRTIDICRRVLADSGLKASDLDELLFVGGSSRMPLVQRMAGEFFGKVPHLEIDPQQVVALGAAVQGRILAGGMGDMVLMDVTPLSLGIESWGGGFDIIIPRNSKIPARGSSLFTNNVDGQRKVKLHVLQGERELARDNRSLGTFELQDLPPMSAGQARIEVTFSLDANGMLQVAAVEKVSNTSASIQVQPSSGLSRDEIDRAVRDSFDNAASDLEQRLLLDRRNEAEALVKAVERAMSQSAASLADDTRAAIEAQLAKTSAAIRSGSPEAVKAETQALSDATSELAEVQMNAVLDASVKGRSLREIQTQGISIGSGK